MMNILVVGLVDPAVYLSDLKRSVPYRIAVPFKAQDAQVSNDLRNNINNGSLMVLKGSLPPGSAFRSPTPVHQRGYVNNPICAVQDVLSAGPSSAVPVQTVKNEEKLKQELEESKALVRDLQSALRLVTTQVGKVQASQVPSTAKQGLTSADKVDEDVPMFIPSVRRDDVDTHINLSSTESTSDLIASKTALKNLRKKK
jgi:hypothetical protein